MLLIVFSYFFGAIITKTVITADKTPSFGFVDKGASYNEDPDVIAIGLQELVDLTAGNIVSTR